ncbi:ABC transporter substrate-binding protein [Paenibacillus xylaniclasticus]|uniref:ABC transporter substrate-binding protein n=1 Tax=Paenibacillus xylaniclasticus TaxID=588083 RepID=UPI000FDB027D|nr:MULTISPECIES: ABC transporter substrate-binding protein [Paenibacillus]GFN32935.1 ABC transporter substrate-binding protein [Paenibacillus curdlanolyticus]
MKKFKLTLLLVLALTLVLSACGKDKDSSQSNGSADGEDKVLQYSFADGSITLPELAEDLGYLGDLKLEKVSTTGNGPEQIQLVATKQLDYAYAFNGAVVKAIAEGVDLKAVVGAYGTNELTASGLYVLEDSPIQSAKDLVGKKIGVNTLGAQAEFITVQYLRDSGLTPEEIKKVQLVAIPYTTAEQTLRSKQVDAIRIGDIVKEKALENGGLRELTNDVKMFGHGFTGGSYSFSKKYIEQNPNTVKTFVEGVAKAYEWTTTASKEEVIERMENIIKKRNPNESYENVKLWKSTGLPYEGASMTDEDWTIWIDYLVNDGQIKPLEPSEVYTNEFNPYVK